MNWFWFILGIIATHVAYALILVFWWWRLVWGHRDGPFVTVERDFQEIRRHIGRINQERRN